MEASDHWFILVTLALNFVCELYIGVLLKLKFAWDVMFY